MVSTPVPIPDVPLASEERDAVVATGIVVAEYPGGMTAVKLQDEEDADGNETSGLSGDHLGKDVLLPNGSGVVIAHRPPLVFCFSNDRQKDHASSGTKARVLDSMTSITVRKELHATTCFGEPLEGNDVPEGATAEQPMFPPTPKVSEIALINHPMLTGVTMVDCLAPIGRGQNMLWVGHDRNYMQSLALDFIRQQVPQGTRCVYACTDDSTSVRARLATASLVDDVHFVGRSDDDTADEDVASKAAEAVAIASAACSIAETYAKEGQHSLVVVDTIDMHKVFWDRTTRSLVDVFGVDSVVQMDREGGASSEMRGFFSSLVQRSAQYNAKQGGGSVTLLLLHTFPKEESDNTEATYEPSEFEGGSDKTKERIELLVKRNIPLTAANLRKIDIPIPSKSEGERRLVLQHIDDLISMSDGQVWFDERAEARGQMPPMDPQRSITRIGIGADTQSRADAPALRRIVEGMRLALSQASSMDGAADTSASQKQVLRQKAFLLAMHQEAGGRRLSESCVALLAAKEGHLDSAIGDGVVAGTEEAKELMQALLDHVVTSESAGDACESIDATLDCDADARGILLESISAFFDSR